MHHLGTCAAERAAGGGEGLSALVFTRWGWAELAESWSWSGCGGRVGGGARRG